MLFKIEMRRLLFRWQTMVALLLGLVIVVIQAKTINPINANWYNNAFAHMIGYDNSGLGSQLYSVLLPLICGLTGASILEEDKKNTMMAPIIARSNKRKYLKSTLLSSFLAGGIAGIFPLIIEGVIYFSQYKITTLPVNPEFYLIDKVGWGYHLFSTYPFVFWVIYLLIVFMFGGFFAQLGLVSAYFPIYKGVETIIPLLIVILSTILGDLSGFLNLSLSQLIIPNYANWNSNSWLWIIGYYLTFTLVILGLTWENLHNDSIS